MVSLVACATIINGLVIPGIATATVEERAVASYFLFISARLGRLETTLSFYLFYVKQGHGSPVFSPLSICSSKMGHTLKNASSHLPSIAEESDEIQETDLISVVFQRKNGEPKIISSSPALFWARFGRPSAFFGYGRAARKTTGTFDIN